MQAPTQMNSAGTDPSFAGAIMALIHQLASNFAPKSVINARQRTDQAVDSADSLGNKF